jgi:hypothetical protein
MKAFLVTVAVLFFVGMLGNLADLARSKPPTPFSNRPRALSVLIEGALGAWAVYLLLCGAKG